MSFEKLALLGIVIFGFMALVQAFRTAREAKRFAKRRTQKRPRRLISSEPVAKDIAFSLVKEVAGKYPELCDEAKETRAIPKKLNTALNSAQDHYLERVLPKFKGQFYLAINEIVLKEDTQKSPATENNLS